MFAISHNIALEYAEIGSILWTKKGIESTWLSKHLFIQHSIHLSWHCKIHSKSFKIIQKTVPFSEVRFIKISPIFLISSIGPIAFESIFLSLFGGLIWRIGIQVFVVLVNLIKITKFTLIVGGYWFLYPNYSNASKNIQRLLSWKHLYSIVTYLTKRRLQNNQHEWTQHAMCFRCKTITNWCQFIF